MVQQLETAPAEAGEPAAEATPAALHTGSLGAGSLNTGSLNTAPQADAPASPASLWASESRVHYSITHTEQRDSRAWIDCDCVIHSD